MTFSFFDRDADEPDVLVPNDFARSLWGKDQMHGVALSGALARSLEQEVAAAGRTDLRPARYNVDLFRAARMKPCRISTRVVREGPRLCLVDALLEQDGARVARASAVFLKPAEPAPGEVWEPADEAPAPPPLELAPISDEPRVPLFASDGVGWSNDFGRHQNGGRKMTWQTGMPVVADEVPSPFVAVAGVADAASMVTNWGSRGVEQINTDITLTLARLPVSLEIGLSATDRVSADGIAVGTAVVFDRQGKLGSAMVSSLANAERAVDFGVHDFTDDPRSSNA